MIYIHIPYCRRKCTYCAFYSTPSKAGHQLYVDALCKEIEQRHNELGERHKVKTIYFGGGTPTILTIQQLQQIIEQLNHYFDTTILEECTIEANPESLTEEYLQSLKQLNFFNRLSIGVQSFRDSDLRTLNRVHSSLQALESIELAHKYGFNNLSTDLIYGLPNQTATDWTDNLNIAQTLDIKHISCYALTIEPNTMLERQIASGRIAIASDETIQEEYESLCRWAHTQGFEHYEVSNFSKPGFRARHNSRYWDRSPYLGFGAAAHSFAGNRRRWNCADNETYINGIFEHKRYYESEILTENDAHNEYIMTALRTSDGISKQKIKQENRPLLTYRIKKYIDAKLITENDTHYLPTEEGLLHTDGIAADLFI